MIMGIPTAARGATAQVALRMAGTRRLIRLSPHAPCRRRLRSCR